MGHDSTMSPETSLEKPIARVVARTPRRPFAVPRTMSAMNMSVSAKFAAAKVTINARRTAAQKPRSVKAQYKVTLETPEGKQEIECADDTYILDAAEVGLDARGRWMGGG